MKVLRFGIMSVLVLGLCVPAFAGVGAKITDHKMKNIDGEEVDLSKYEGKVLLLVNVASKCGLTPQYEQLVAIRAKYKDQGFEILGFPANNFLSQEPGNDAEIKEFCSTKFGVDFPLFSKISVKDDDIDPLYQELTSKEANGEFGGEIKWNFTKFLVNREGKVIARFEPRTKPDAPEVIEAIERELGD